MADYTGGDLAADHLVVLVHGLWGNPNHMRNVAKALRAKHPADKLYILCAQRNSGSFTYDGAELGGERVCSEIQEELHAIEARGGKITKLSMIGYSHGGLVARYAVGLLYAKGILDNLECINFTAFASPFLGVRSPLRGATNHIWNVLGARTLSMSGRQLFMIDNFRNTGRPLLAILADPNSIFYKGLAKFRRRTLYANIIHDRSTVYYTSGIDKTNPYTDLDKVRLNYIPGYEDVILDPIHPVEHIPPHSWKQESFPGWVQKWVGRIPFALALAVLVPIGVVAYLLNSVVQTVLSSKRIALHEKGEAGIDIADYRPPVLINELREAVEDAYEGLNSSQRQEYLGLSTDDEEETEEEEDEETEEEEEEETDEDSSDDHDHEASAPLLGSAAEDKQQQFPSLVVDDEKAALMAAATTGRRTSEANILRRERKQSMAGQPTLALTPYQFEMIQALDSLGWRKYRVRIRRNRHSHAAIIVRMDKEAFSEGHVVLRHWLNEEFMV